MGRGPALSRQASASKDGSGPGRRPGPPSASILAGRLPPSFFVLLLVLIPALFLPLLGLADIIQSSIQDTGSGLPRPAALEVLERSTTWRSLGLSFLQAGLSALITLLLAMPGSFALARYRFPGRNFIMALGTAGFVLPSLLIILAVIGFYGKNGPLSLLGLELPSIYSLGGIVLAHVVFNLAISLSILSQGWREIDPRLREASVSLGDSQLGRFFRLYLPLMSRRILAAFILVFIYCFLSFSIVLIFGGVGFTTMEVQIYREFFVALNPGGAALLSLLQLLLTGALTLLLHLSRKDQPRGFREDVDRPIREIPILSRILWLFYWFVMALLVLAPMLFLVYRAFFPEGSFEFTSFQVLFAVDPESSSPVGRPLEVERLIRSSPAGVIFSSLGIAALVGTLTSTAAFLTARALKRWPLPAADGILLLPMLLSGVSLSLGLGQLFPGGEARLAGVILAQSVLAFPLVFRVLRDAVIALPENFRLAASNLGAGVWFRFRTIDFPLLRRPLLNAFAFAAAVSLGDFTAAFTLGAGQIVTLPVALYRLMGFRSFNSALALAVLTLGIVTTLFLFIQAGASRDPAKEGGPVR